MIYVICVCLHTVVSNTYYVVVLFCLSSPCVLCCLHLVSCVVFTLCLVLSSPCVLLPPVCRRDHV